MPNILRVNTYVGGGIQFPIKSAVVVSPGDLVGIDSNGQVVLADKDTGPVKARGFAVFVDDLGSSSARTGVAGLTVKCAIAREGLLNGFTSQTINGDVFLSGTAGGYTQTAPSTNADLYQKVGYAIAADTVEIMISSVMLSFQTAGNSTAALLA